jgi:serine O-acetyltransferase
LRSVLERILRLFDVDAPQPRSGVFALIASDYVALYREKNEAPARMALMFVPRFIQHPALHATAMIRLALVTPKFLFGLWRTLLISKHSIDINRDMKLGPGLMLPHPMNIVLGWGLEVGANVTILHDCSLGGWPTDPRNPLKRPETEDLGQVCPVIGDRVTIYMKSVILGPVTIGDDAVIGARSWVVRDVAADEVVKGEPAT